MLWKEKEKDLKVIENLEKKLGISSWLSHILYTRGIKTPEEAFYFLYGDIENTLSPFVFSDMKKAVDYLKKQIQEKKPLYIVGDKDVDGITGTAILYAFFQKMGVQNIYYNFPIQKESYGFSQRIMDDILSKQGLETVITVDCGIKENYFIDILNQKGINTIITDHHTPDENVPPAYAILNPHLEKLKIDYLSGSAVALKLIQALYFSYHSFYNHKMLFVARQNNIWKAGLAENFILEKQEIEFENWEEVIKFAQSFEKILVITEEPIKEKKENEKIQWISVIDFAKKHLDIKESMTIKKLSKKLKIYFDDEKIYRTLFSIVKKIFFRFMLPLEKKLSDFFKYATLGTVCDYMPLNSVENHIIVREGIVFLDKETPEYIQVISNKRQQKITLSQIGFEIGPLLNAGGRFGEPQTAFQLLIEKNEEKRQSYCEQLKNLNKKRREIENLGYQEAIQNIELYQKDEPALFYYSEQIIQGITGILATKISHLYKKPSFVFCIEKDSDEIVGSGRSFKNIDILELVEGCKKIFTRFGGHKNACGMTFPRKFLDEFIASTKESSKKVVETLSEEEDLFYYDIEIQLDKIQSSFIAELKNLEPFGYLNEEPYFFSKKLTPFDTKVIGKNQNHLKFRVKENPFIDFVAWNMVDKQDLLKNSRIDIVYHLSENFYQNMISIQGRVVYIRETLE